ncbi:MAG: alpha/beta hydrolase fold domain-containing protein, partial [Methanococcaceae archaeon]
MPSMRANLFRLLLKHRHLLRLQLRRRDVFDFNTSIQGFRDDCEKGAKLFGKLPEGIKVAAFKINNMNAEWIMPAGVGKSKVIFYIHGGGYVSGSCSDHRAIVARIVKETQVSAVLFEYRLAPEHPFPAAVEDSVAAYNWLIGQAIAPAQIVIAGESAGG